MGKVDKNGITTTFFIVTPNPDQLAELVTLVDRGQLHVEIAVTFPLAKGREAFASGRQSNRRAGKTVILVSD